MQDSVCNQSKAGKPAIRLNKFPLMKMLNKMAMIAYLAVKMMLVIAFFAVEMLVMIVSLMIVMIASVMMKMVIYSGVHDHCAVL